MFFKFRLKQPQNSYLIFESIFCIFVTQLIQHIFSSKSLSLSFLHVLKHIKTQCLFMETSENRSLVRKTIPKAKQFLSILLVVRCGILLILLALASGFGLGAYNILSKQENERFEGSWEIQSQQIADGIFHEFKRFEVVHRITNNIHQSYTRDKSHGLMPFVTLPGRF